MEAAPPSYEKATLVDPWDIIARYIPSNDLCSAALVCERWHSIFSPHLWGNPASHFGIEDDHVYIALTRFKRTLKTARLVVRSLTHTLHLPPAHAELYNGPQADWLRDILEKLPNLQSLIVRGLPFFDYSALQALKYKRPSVTQNTESSNFAIELPGSPGFSFQPLPQESTPSFGLRLLDASRCPNVTSNSLALALGRFERLLYLDLSFTYAARDPIVLKALRRIYGLQVFKTRGVNLTDDALEVLSHAIGRRVRSLDLRNNNITDRGVRKLLDECFTLTGEEGLGLEDGRRSPALLPYIGREMLDIYQGEDFESFIRSAFTRRFVGRLAIEDAPEGGITHLYISGNQISVEGVSGLLRAGRLHVFDAHSVVRESVKNAYATSPGGNVVEIDMPGVEKLTPVMARCVSTSLTFLRIGHGIITKDAPNMDVVDEVVQGRSELADTALPDLPRDAVEMDATSAAREIFELPSVQTPKHELPSNPFEVGQPSKMNGARDRPDTSLPAYQGPRRGSAFAPEVVDSLSSQTDEMTLLSPVSAEDPSGWGTLNGTLSGELVSQTLFTATPAPEIPVEWPSRLRSYSSVAHERRATLKAHVSNSHNLHPAMLPHLSTLVLTDVPPFSPDKIVSDRLICFIRQCAGEASLAKSHAEVDYALPPGRKGHAVAMKHSADKIFALKRVVLELAPDLSARRGSKATQWQHSNTKSVTEDRDSESLWSAAETDFSFFGDEDYSFPSLDSGRYAHSPRAEKEVNYGYERNSLSKAPERTASPLRLDNIALLSAFRKERKLVHQRRIAAGVLEAETEGYWEGAVQIIRPNDSIRTDEAADYYGNRFEKTYLY